MSRQAGESGQNSTARRRHGESRRRRRRERGGAAVDGGARIRRLTRVVAAVLVAALAAPLLAACSATGSGGSSGGGSSAAPLSSASGPRGLAAARATAALTAFDNAFYVTLPKGAAYDKLTTAGRRSDFWRQAEDIELMADAYQTLRDPAYRQKVLALRLGVSSLWGKRWTKRAWNDDIMWMVLASIRAYQVTGQARFLDVARQNFDATFARAWDGRLGGGLWWTTAKKQKNNTTNDPAALAACLLYRITHDASYLTKAEQLYGWVRRVLFDPRTGALADSITLTTTGGSIKKVVNRVDLSYNYGSFIGAADLLHAITGKRRYYTDGLMALTYARAHLTYADGVLRSEGGGNQNGGGFKGIFCRWALRFVHDNHLGKRFLPWFRKNARAAWSHRNSQDLMGQDWVAPTGSGLQYSFDCSSAVALLVALARP